MDIDRSAVQEDKKNVRLGKKEIKVPNFKWYNVFVERKGNGYKVSLPDIGIEIFKKRASWAGEHVLTAVILARYKELTGKDYTYERKEKDQQRVKVCSFNNGALILLDRVAVHHVYDDGSLFLYGPVLDELASLGGERGFYGPDFNMIF